MTSSSHTGETLVLRTSLVSKRQQHVIDVLAAWFGLVIEVEVGSEQSGVSMLECWNGFKWTWRNHEILRDGTSLAAEVEWGKWHDETHGVALMLPCWNSQKVHAGPRSASGESHLDFDPLGVTFWGVTCWAEQAGQWPLDEHARPTTDQLPWRHSEEKARCMDHTIAMRNQHHWPWVELMWASMFEAMGLAWRRSPEFKPTVDIDVAFKHLGRPRWKSTLLQVRDVVMGRWDLVAQRRKVRSGRLFDPYDTYAFFNEVHRNQPLRWFVLASDRRLPFDVGLDPDREVLPALVASLASAHEEARVGWHPGYVAVNDEAVRAHERQRISMWPGMDMSAVRTHFLRGEAGAWWRVLESMGIEEDMSLGWARDVGFRSGVSRAFQAYDLGEERPLKLRIHPVAVMDVGMRQMWSAEEARGALTSLMAVVSDVGGHWMSCWHNTSVSEEEPWLGWRATYLHMVDEARHWS
jgi:hypothetical protein